MRRDPFQAIADPTRRKILTMTAQRAMNINAVSGHFDVSRTAVYKHIRILTECGLLVVRQQGRERYCEARMGGLGEVSDWISHYRQFWNSKLDALGLYLEETGAAGTPRTAPDQKSRMKHKKQAVKKRRR